MQNMLVVNNMIDRERLADLSSLVKSYSGEISVHLPNPKWDDRVGITYDTAHSITRIDDQQAKKSEVKKCIQHFKDDIIIYHITPSIERHSDGIDSVKGQFSRQIIEWVYEFTKKYNVDALFFVEAHASLESMSRLYAIISTSLSNVLSEGNLTADFPSVPSER